MKRIGHLLVTLRPGESRPYVPSQADCIAGAGRPSCQLDRGGLDRRLSGLAGGFQVTAAFHARRRFGRIGEQSAAFDDLEERLGLSRTYRIKLAEPRATQATLEALRGSLLVEEAAVQTLAFAPLTAVASDAPTAALRRPSRELVAAAFEQVGVAEALRIEPGDARVSVAIIDTGVSLGHPDLQRKLLAGYDCVDLGIGRIGGSLRLVGDSHGRDFAPHDETGHGSHVAGIVGAKGWGMPRGVGGRCLLLPVRTLAAARDERLPGAPLIGVGALADIDLAIKVAVDLGADVLNLSLGTEAAQLDPSDPRPHARVVDYAARRGCVLVAASGNSGVEEDYYPAALPEVIAVGSVDSAGRRSRFSTGGEHLALAAPGKGVFSLGQHGYRFSSGTSHAAPFVSGAAALLLARARRGGRTLGGGEVRRLLTDSAQPLPHATRIEAGAGLLDVPAALRRLDTLRASAAPAPTPEEDGQ